MNTEQSLLQLLLENPKEIVELSSQGFKKEFIQNKSLRPVFDLILNTYSKFQSVPTTEELESLKFKFIEEKIPHTINHCAHSIYSVFLNLLQRKMLLKAGDILIQEGPEAQKKFITEALAKMPRFNNDAAFKEIKESTDKFLEAYNKRSKNKNKITGVETGFPTFDLHTRGLQPQWLTVIQGRNGQFKSWVMANWAKNMFLNGKNVLIFSAEMSYQEIENRIHSLALGIPESKIRDGELDINEHEKMQKYLEQVKNEEIGGKLIIHDNPDSLTSIKLDIQSILQKHSIDIIFIDSVYRLSSKADHEGLTQIAKGCKNMAREFGIPVVVTIQANREFAKENKKFKREVSTNGMSAAGTDAWNTDSDIMLILHRYDEMKPFNYNDFVLDKFRHGQQGIRFILEINLKVPIIQEVNLDEAIMRLENANPEAKETSDNIFNETSNQFLVKDLLVDKFGTLGEDELFLEGLVNSEN